jgi:hypothetical protein
LTASNPTSKVLSFFEKIQNEINAPALENVVVENSHQAINHLLDQHQHNVSPVHNPIVYPAAENENPAENIPQASMFSMAYNYVASFFSRSSYSPVESSESLIPENTNRI